MKNVQKPGLAIFAPSRDKHEIPKASLAKDAKSAKSR
jgi:hypothetical protein